MQLQLSWIVPLILYSTVMYTGHEEMDTILCKKTQCNFNLKSLILLFICYCSIFDFSSINTFLCIFFSKNQKWQNLNNPFVLGISFKKKSFSLISWTLSSILTLLGQGGGWISPHFLQMAILHEKRGLEVQNFVTFPDSLWTFRKSKKNWFIPPALKQHPGAPTY